VILPARLMMSMPGVRPSPRTAAGMCVINESGRLTERSISSPEKSKPFHRLAGSPRPPWWIAVTSARSDSIDMVRSPDHAVWEHWLAAREPSKESSNRSG
jgi:hypothetical protein